MIWRLEFATKGLELTDSELRTLEWLSGWESQTAENVAAIIDKARHQTATRIYKTLGVGPIECGPGAGGENV